MIVRQECDVTVDINHCLLKLTRKTERLEYNNIERNTITDIGIE